MKRPLTATEQAFSMLNMSSNPADLLPQVRIRLAGLELFGEQGFDKTTIRQIAERAGVSPGLVIHHFGSKNALRAACDQHAMEVVLAEKTVFTVGPIPNFDNYLDDHPEMIPVYRYLVRSLRDGGPVAEAMFDRLCQVSDELLTTGEQYGMIHAQSDRAGAAALLAALAAGLMLVEGQFARRLGGESLTDPRIVQRYVRVSTELFSGMFTEQ